MGLVDKKSTKGLTGDTIKFSKNDNITKQAPILNKDKLKGVSNPQVPGIGTNKLQATPDKPISDIKDVIPTPPKSTSPIKGSLSTPDKSTPVVQPQPVVSNLLNFKRPEIKKRDLNQSIHLGANGQIRPGYSRLDLVDDTKSDFNKGNTNTISLFSEPEQFQVGTVEKPTVDLQKRPIKEISKKNNNLTPTSLPGQNNLVSNTTVQKPSFGQNNLFSNTTVQKPSLGQNNLSSDFNKVKPSIGTNNLSSDFSKPRTSIGNNNLTSNFNKPKTSIGNNNLNSGIDTSVKYK